MENKTEKAKVIPFKRKKNYKKIIAMIGLIVLVAFVALFTPWFNIKAIEVNGNSRVKQEEVINISGMPLGQNIFKINYFRAKSNIKNNPYIEKVSVSRDYPNKVIINVEERKRAGFIQHGGNYLIIDKSGMVLEVVNNLNDLDAPIVLGFKFNEYKLGDYLNPSQLEKGKYDILIKCLQEIYSSKLAGKLSKIDITNSTHMVIWAYNYKYQINIGDENNFKYKLDFANTIIDKQEKAKGPSGLINFSSENRAIFKPR